MEPDELRRLWDGAGGGEPAPGGAGLLGLHVVDDPVALAGMALAVLGLPLDDTGPGPADIRRASQRYADWLPALAGEFRAADYGDVEVVRDDPAVAFMQAHERLADIVAAGAAPLVLGGDALVSVPVLQVLTGKLRGRLGVVAFTPAYEIAPEPLYAPASRWARALELGVVSPANLALVGGRAAPPDGPARRVLDGLGATTFSLEDVLRDGMATVAQEALETAASGTEAVYLSVDLGVIAGIGDPVGLEARELAAGVAVVSSALLAAADICGPRPLPARGPTTRRSPPPAWPRRSSPAWLAGSPESAVASARRKRGPAQHTDPGRQRVQRVGPARGDRRRSRRREHARAAVGRHHARGGPRQDQWDFFKRHGGTPWPVEMLKKAEHDLDAFVDVLEQAGVTVRQPEPYAYERPLATPDWEVASSCYALMPRDVLFVIGDQIIEAPMGWRSRSTERLAYRELCKEYFRGGARWVAAPPPRLSDESFTRGFVAPEEDEPQRFLPTEYEPMFDAADAIKCGRDVFIARSSCCNRFGIEWLQRHLGDGRGRVCSGRGARSAWRSATLRSSL